MAPRVFLTLLVLAAGSTTSGAQAPGTLPTSLSNAEFWRIVSEFSEAGGNFASDNYTSNELAIGQVATELIARGRFGGAYLGVGPEQNFTYIATLKPDIAFIVDIRRQAVMQHLMYKAIFEMSNNRADFISRLFSRPVPPSLRPDSSIRHHWELFVQVQPDSLLYASNLGAIYRHLSQVRGFSLSPADSVSIRYVYQVFFRAGPGISYRVTAARASTPIAAPANFVSLTNVTDVFDVPRSFLASEEHFASVKGMHSKNLIIPVVGDFGGSHALRSVADYLREKRAVLNAYYTSNVEQYLFRPNDTWRQFYSNVAQIPLDSSSVFIRPGLAATVGGGSVTYTVFRAPPTGSGAASQQPPAVQQGTPPPQLPTLGYVTGVLTDTTTGRPVQRAAVQLQGTGIAVASDTVGRYLIANVTPGVHALSLYRVGYAPITVSDVRVAAGGPTVVDFRISPSPLVLSTAATPTNATMPLRLASPVQERARWTLCPIIEFLAAHNAGRVLVYDHATRCVR